MISPNQVTEWKTKLVLKHLLSKCYAAGHFLKEAGFLKVIEIGLISHEMLLPTTVCGGRRRAKSSSNWSRENI